MSGGLPTPPTVSGNDVIIHPPKKNNFEFLILNFELISTFAPEIKRDNLSFGKRDSATRCLTPPQGENFIRE
jgi:hypothetical protein